MGGGLVNVAFGQRPDSARVADFTDAELAAEIAQSDAWFGGLGSTIVNVLAVLIARRWRGVLDAEAEHRAIGL